MNIDENPWLETYDKTIKIPEGNYISKIKVPDLCELCFDEECYWFDSDELLDFFKIININRFISICIEIPVYIFTSVIKWKTFC